MGRLMMTAGLGHEQHFWCNLCSAYTGGRVRKLAKVCDRTPRCVPSVHLLRNSQHPKHGTSLTVLARRLLKADVGDKLALLDDPTHDEAANLGHKADADARNCAAVREAIERPFPCFTEDDATF